MGKQDFSNAVMNACITIQSKKMQEKLWGSIKTPYGTLEVSDHKGIFRPHNRSDGYPRINFNLKTGKVSIRDEDAPTHKWAASVILFNSALDSL